MTQQIRRPEDLVKPPSEKREQLVVKVEASRAQRLRQIKAETHVNISDVVDEAIRVYFEMLDTKSSLKS